MEYSKYEIQSLANLGLNSVEIRVYLSLSKYRKASVASISKVLNISRFEAYKSLIRLYDLGLIEEVFGNSMLVKAVSTQQTLKILREKMIDTSSKLKIDIESLMANIKMVNESRITDSKFILIPKKNTLLKKVIKTVGKCRENVDFIVSWKRFDSARTCFPDDFNFTAKCRCILEQPLRTEDFEIIRKVRSLGTEIRFVPNHQDVALGIFDRKEMVIVENPDLNKESSTSLWTDNDSILTIAKIYFENLWQTATEKPLLIN